MKCPVCQAKLLPVAGEMFCLQCGEAVHETGESSADFLTLEDTSDPLLRRAISDATDGAVVFSEVPVLRVPEVRVREQVAVLSDKPGHSFSSIRSILAPPRPATTNGSFAGGSHQPIAEVPQIQGPQPEQARQVAAGRRFRDEGILRAWALGVLGLVLFVGTNLAIGSYFADRVYPGVKVGNISVGGWTFGELHDRLPSVLPKPALVALVGDRRYPIDSSLLGAASFPELENSLQQSGRSTSLPLLGLVSSMFSSPVQPTYSLSDNAVSKTSAELSALVYRQSSNAAVTIVGSNVLVLADKPGAALDPVVTSAALKASYGRVGTVTLEPVRVPAAIGAQSFANDVSLAQSMMGQPVQIIIGKSTYTPTSQQIGNWLVFSGPGKGVAVDAAGVAAFVATIPGSFDRAAAVSGVVAALNTHKGGSVSPSIARPTANPSPASIAATTPAASYTYCIDQPDGTSASVSGQAASMLGGAGSWALGGKVRFTRAVAGCNFVLSLASSDAMRVLDPACSTQTTCRIHNDLAISDSSWANAPKGWVGTLATYRGELINHVVGQWLGFDHPACSVVATNTPVLTTPSVIIPGCSPKWFAVPPELQDTKVLGGF